ncbi:aminoacetone oxidase family FAD-binding enzyme [Patescibacteria group bacterium]|nr:aminoacetone oxidase family FAD-binding enzyme [Patescibacteria group bacterium]
MRIAIIGGGAAGMMCAATLQEQHPAADIFLIERNNGLGKKVIISGGGRCNVTTGIHDVRTLLTKYPRGNKFLTRAMYNFPPDAVYNWFEDHGVPLKIQADNRAFPASDDGHDIVAVFERLFANSNVRVFLKTTLLSVAKENNEFVLTMKDQVEPLVVDRIVLTTGGQAYRQTGSTGDGYAFAIALGHTITKLAPSLNAFFTQETWPTQLSGLSFPNATISSHGEKKQRFTGPFLFTHKGVSGPAVFALSSLVAFETYNAQQPLPITIDLFPEQSIDSVRVDLEHIMALNSQKQFVNTLGFFVPHSLAAVIVSELALDVTKRVNEISKKDVLRVCNWLKAIPLHVVQRGAGDEFVTAGGVPLSEIDPATLESTICPDLYFAGEIMDVDGFTGGFNLQASWAAGRLVGMKLC